MGLLNQEKLGSNNSDNGVVFENDFVSLRSSGKNDQVAVTVGTGRGAVALVVWNNKVLMFKTPRYATDSLEWELPRAGSLDDESPQETIERCVEGWCGVALNPSSFDSLGTMTPDSEVLTNEVDLLFASARSGAIRANHADTKWIEIDELVDACMDGEVEDSFTCMAVLRARLNGTI